jgi:hypothetical protein
MTRQRGLTTVEFAIVGAVFMMLLFGAIEFGRLMFTYAALREGTRRAARLAAVCPVNSDAIYAAALWRGEELVPRTVNESHVRVDYLDETGATVGDPANSLAAIRYVRVRIMPFPYELQVPFVPPSFPMPEFRSTLPRESLGWHDPAEAGGCTP